MECMKRRLFFSNFFPPFFQRDPILKTDTVEMEEEIWSEPGGRRSWVRSRNITWEENAVIASTAVVVSYDTNPNWSYWEQETIIDFNSFGVLGLILELYLKRHLREKMRQEIKTMENVMSYTYNY